MKYFLCICEIILMAYPNTWRQRKLLEVKKFWNLVKKLES